MCHVMFKVIMENLTYLLYIFQKIYITYPPYESSFLHLSTNFLLGIHKCNKCRSSKLHAFFHKKLSERGMDRANSFVNFLVWKA